MPLVWVLDGKVQLPREVRMALGLRPQDEIVWTATPDGLVLRPLRRPSAAAAVAAPPGAGPAERRGRVVDLATGRGAAAARLPGAWPGPATAKAAAAGDGNGGGRGAGR